MRNRARLVFFSLGLFTLAKWSGAIDAAEPPLLKPAAALAQTADDARQRLQQLIDVDFLNVPLEELAPILEQVVGVMVWVDSPTVPPAARAANSLFQSAPTAPAEKPLVKTFSLRVKQVPAEKALDLLLTPGNWDWSLLGATLHLSPSDSPNMFTEVYDVRDLIFRGDDARYHEYDFDSLIEVITSTVEPTAWTEVGGKGNIKPFRGGGRETLVISQTPAAHRKITELLAQLRKVPTGNADSKKVGEAPPTYQNQLAKQTPVPPATDEIPTWWPQLAGNASKAPLAWRPLSPPLDGQASLLAWHVVVDDQSYPTLRALVLLRSKSLHAWVLAVEEIRRREPGLSGQWRVKGLDTVALFEPLKRPPHNKDVYRFLASVGGHWQFDDLPKSKLVAANVLAQQWADSSSEPPEQLYGARLPRTYERIIFPEVDSAGEKAESLLAAFGKLDDGVGRLQATVDKLQEATDRLYFKLSSQK